jgi:hypothetical protein
VASNKAINQMLMRIARRAEMQNEETLVRTFVQIEEIENSLRLIDHQVLYGRRGTGKTHALNYLASEIAAGGDLPIYLDLRTIGSSSGLYSDESEPISQRGTGLLIDVLEAVHTELFERSILDDRFEGALPYLDAFGDTVTQVHVSGPVTIGSELQGGQSDSTQSGSEIGLSAVQPQLSARASSSKKRQRSIRMKQTVQRTGEERYRLSFGSLSKALANVCSGLAPARIWLLLDEWSSLPLELQPLLADMLRRTFFPSRGITVKIGAIERRSRFFQRMPGGEYLGIELGADTAAALNLDEHLLATEAGPRAESFFSELLYKHLSVLMESLGYELSMTSPSELVLAAFSEGAFREFVRAAEGIPRDALNIVGLAAAKASERPISVPAIRAAARQFYVRDKEAGIAGNAQAQEVWRRLQRTVITTSRTRTFLLPRRRAGTPKSILDLYDARLIHLLQSGLATREQPGIVFDGYAVDYGSYVQLIQEDEIAALWDSRNRPWEYYAGGAILPDRFDESMIFEVTPFSARNER